MADRIKEALKDEIRDLKDKLRRAESALAAYEPAQKPAATKKKGGRKPKPAAPKKKGGRKPKSIAELQNDASNRAQNGAGNDAQA